VTTAAGSDDHHPVEVFEPPPQRRTFSPADVLRLLLGTVLVVLGIVVARFAQATIRGVEVDLLRLVSRLPNTVESLLLGLAQVATSLIPTVTLVVLLVRRRWRVALLLLLTAVLANLAMATAGLALFDSDLAQLLQALRAEDSTALAASYPSSHVLASTTAVVTVAAPWLTHRWKRTLWQGVGLLMVLRLLGATQPAFDIVASLGVGLVVGSFLLLVFGSPTNEPGPDELVDAMRSAGLRPQRIERRDPKGSVLRYGIESLDGRALEMSLRTPDERDADLLTRLYRRVRFQSSELEERYTTLKRRIEHEALVLTLAERHGVRAPVLVTLGTTSGGSAFIVTDDAPNRPVGPDDLRSDAFLDALWTQVRDLHDGSIAHRGLGLESISVDGGARPWLHDFDRAQTAPSQQDLARDIAQLLAETAIVIGAPAAVTAAVASLGAARVAPALRMLQPLALPPSTRARAAKVDGLLDRLRDEVNRATGEPGLELDELERIKPRTLLVVAASTVAFYSLLPQLADLGDTADTISRARPAWLAGLLAASVLTYITAAVALQGAVAEPVPFGANLRAQTARSFAGLVGPAGAGGFALTGRFLKRLGVGPSEAAASVAVSALIGFAMHLVLLAGFLVWSGQSAVGGFSLPDRTTILLALVAVVAVAGGLAAIGRVRRQVLLPALQRLRFGLAHLGEAFSQPGRVVALFGGSTATSLLYVAAMACAVQAFGGGLGMAQIGAGYLGAVALAILAPTPGGLGALEAALIAAYTGFGLSGPVAVSAVLTFRLATFWLPILPGWLSLGWMQRKSEV